MSNYVTMELRIVKETKCNMKNLLYLLVMGLMLSVLSACSDDATIEDEPLIYEARQYITKGFMEDNAKLGITEDEVQAIFGNVTLSGKVDQTETWLYDSSSYKPVEYKQDLAAFAAEEIKQDKLAYQLYINFIEDKAVMYSYFYKGDDGNVWQYQVTDSGEPLENIVSP